MAKFGRGWPDSETCSFTGGRLGRAGRPGMVSSTLWELVLSLGGVVWSPPHCFSLHVVSRPPAALLSRGLFSNRRPDFVCYTTANFQNGSCMISSHLGLEPTAAITFLLTSRYVRKTNSWMFGPLWWGFLFWGWMIPCGDDTKGWLLWGLKLSPSLCPLLCLSQNKELFSGSQEHHCLDYCFK